MNKIHIITFYLKCLIKTTENMRNQKCIHQAFVCKH